MLSLRRRWSWRRGVSQAPGVRRIFPAVGWLLCLACSQSSRVQPVDPESFCRGKGISTAGWQWQVATIPAVALQIPPGLKRDASTEGGTGWFAKDVFVQVILLDSASVDTSIGNTRKGMCGDCVERTILARCPSGSASRGPIYLFRESGGYTGGSWFRLLTWRAYRGGRLVQFSGVTSSDSFLDTVMAISSTMDTERWNE